MRNTRQSPDPYISHSHRYALLNLTKQSTELQLFSVQAFRQSLPGQGNFNIITTLIELHSRTINFCNDKKISGLR
jgi:hypothetical protein